MLNKLDKKFILIFIFFILLIIFFFAFNKKENNLNKEINYNQLADVNRVNQIIDSYSDIIHIFLFSRDDCDSCIKVSSSLNKTFEELLKDSQNTYYINYFDTNLNKADDGYNELLSALEIEYVPTIYIYNYKKDLKIKIEDLSIIENSELLLKEIKILNE